MPHIPEFPPNWREDFAPGRPPIEPPLPRFMWNPLTPEQKAALSAEFGPWAAGRTIGMISPRETFESHRRVARRMYETFMGKAPPALKERREPTAERRRREPTIAEKLAPIVGVLTPEIRQELISDLRESWEIGKKIPRSAQEKAAAALLIVDWSEEKGVKVPGGRAAEIVEEALAKSTPARA